MGSISHSNQSTLFLTLLCAQQGVDCPGQLYKRKQFLCYSGVQRVWKTRHETSTSSVDSALTIHVHAKRGKTGRVMGRYIYFPVYLSASFNRQLHVGGGWKGIAWVEGFHCLHLTKLKEMVPGDKLCKPLHCPQGHFPRYKRFPCCICRDE